MSSSAAPKFTNRLAHETSPYLLQHAHNPVDWYPWGPEAIERARREDKPIFLSVGYSTCYWCHVMERQCFENEEIAARMNEGFVNVKVDREERPDVDQLYMLAVQVLTRHGGWPMSVFLTPQLEPFYGGTYFPPNDGFGRPGFPRVLASLSDAYRNRPEDVKQTTGQLVTILRRLAGPRGSSRKISVDRAFVEELLERSTSDFDPVHGGFGTAPKFPRETLLELILTANRLLPNLPGNKRRMAMLGQTLDALADGGIRDHLGGGFHRYSTDAKWLVPHFEIMLYDNAMLGYVYAEASRQMKEPKYAQVARGVFEFVLREMTSPLGAFYTAFDAEVDAREGANYLWTDGEVEDALLAERPGQPTFTRDDADLFCMVYGLDEGPNFADPHGGSTTPDQNILYLPYALDAVAGKLGTTRDALDARLAPMRQKLYAERQTRKQPLLDTKVLTSWNALMIRAMAEAGRILQEERYTRAAGAAADFLMKHHRDPATGRLLRTSRDGGPAKYGAFLDDYAFLADALLSLGRRDEAVAVANVMRREFEDAKRGGFYFTSSSATDLIIRQMTGSDSPLPSGNGIAARVLLALNDPAAARRAIGAFAPAIDDAGESMSALVEAAVTYLARHDAFDVEPADAVEISDAPTPPKQLAERAVSVRGDWVSDRELAVSLEIQQGLHVQANPTLPGLIATTVTASVPAEVEYPHVEARQVGFSDEAVPVYDDRVTVTLRFPSAVTEAVRVTVTYQACDDDTCLPVATKTVEVAPRV